MNGFHNWAIKIQGPIVKDYKQCVWCGLKTDLNDPPRVLTCPGVMVTGQTKTWLMSDGTEVGLEPSAFFQPTIPSASEWRASALMHYPGHWITHLMHAAEVVGYRHPDPVVRGVWTAVYRKLCESMHLTPETKDQMVKRLSEDRVSKGSVVS